MKFGPVAPADALGGVLAPSGAALPPVMKKGTVIGAAEVEALTSAGVNQVVVAALDAGDVSEDVAAATIAAVAGDGVNVERAFTGGANLFAAQAGVLVADRVAVDQINRVDEAITLATLPAFKPVVDGEMIATVKIIPFGVAARLRDRASRRPINVLRVAPYRVSKVGVSRPCCRALRRRVEKTLAVTAERLAPAGARIIAEKRVAHDERDGRGRDR